MPSPDFSRPVVARGRKRRPDKACDRGPRSRTRAVRRGGRGSVTKSGRMIAASQQTGCEKSGLDPGEVRLELPKPLLLCPDVKRKRGQLVDVRNGGNLTGQVNAVKVGSTSLTRVNLDVVEAGSRIVGPPLLIILPTGGTSSPGKGPLMQAERANQRQGLAVALRPQDRDLRPVPAPGTQLGRIRR